MKTVSNQQGVMLVEVLVSSILSMVIGFLIYTVFFMYSNQSNQSISSFLMQQQYDNVSHQIGRDVRRSSFILLPGETPTAHGSGYDTVSSINLTDGGGSPVAKYAIIGARLFEGITPNAYQAGGGTVQLVESSSRFIVNPQRKQIEVQLTMAMSKGGKTYTVSPRRDVFVCRN